MARIVRVRMECKDCGGASRCGSGRRVGWQPPGVNIEVHRTPHTAPTPPRAHLRESMLLVLAQSFSSAFGTT